MSLSTMRRRNSRPREGDTQHGAPQSEDQARGPPPRRGEERLEVGGADRRLDALIEEERGRAVSLPAEPGVKRLEVTGGRSQSSQQGPLMGQLQGPVMGQQTVQDALSDPRAEAMGLGALQNAVRHSFGLLQQALGRPVPQQGLLGPLLQKAKRKRTSHLILLKPLPRARKRLKLKWKLRKRLLHWRLKNLALFYRHLRKHQLLEVALVGFCHQLQQVLNVLDHVIGTHRKKKRLQLP